MCSNVEGDTTRAQISGNGVTGDHLEGRLPWCLRRPGCSWGHWTLAEASLCRTAFESSLLQRGCNLVCLTLLHVLMCLPQRATQGQPLPPLVLGSQSSLLQACRLAMGPRQQAPGRPCPCPWELSMKTGAARHQGLTAVPLSVSALPWYAPVHTVNMYAGAGVYVGLLPRQPGPEFM